MITREQILALYNTGPQAVIDLVTPLCQTMEQLQCEITALQARVTELENQRATTSRNSSKPPSRDGLARQPRSLRQPPGKKPGGQPGHQGATRQAVPEPDQRLTYAPAQCPACGTGLKEVAGRLTPERRQVFALPPMHLVVTEHRVVITACPGCGQDNVGAFPAGLPCGASYGAGGKRLLLSLNQEHLLPSARSGQIVEDLCGQPVSEGTLAAAVQTCATALVETEARITQGVLGSEVAHFDETGRYVADKRGWLHSASTPPVTHSAYHDKRGTVATRAIGILPAFQGRAIHDGCSAYGP